MMMEQPHPGIGGRHRRTHTYGRSPHTSITPRQALARDIVDLRRIYMEDGAYTAGIQRSLLDLIRRNREAFPEVFRRMDQ
ncbi:MAG: hypothetical protein H6849_00825 [Alphaproteobacteria bacterium]|nr:MAG: hypothetical protein H6849_00825 [Alphaproteobacteria bacterium]